MHFVLLRKSNTTTEAGVGPDEPWLTTRLAPSAAGVSVRFRNDEPIVVRGGQSPGTQGIAGLSLLETDSRELALELVRQRVADSAGDVDVDVREAGCPGGLESLPPLEPSSGLQRFAILLRSEALEQGFVPGPELLAPMAARNAEATTAGVMLAGDGLKPSSRAARVKRSTRGDVSVTDGPFAETKELVAGYWLIQVPSIEDAIAWVVRYPYPVRDHCDVDIRPVQ